MSERWVKVDGRLRKLTGSHDDIVDEMRELRADGHTVADAPVPRQITSRDLAARQHQRRRR